MIKQTYEGPQFGDELTNQTTNLTWETLVSVQFWINFLPVETWSLIPRKSTWKQEEEEGGGGGDKIGSKEETY
jgi:hypothetical protein